MRSREQWFCRAGEAGSILVLALWALFLLGMLAIAVSAHVGTRIELARHMKTRVRAYYAARAGAQAGMAILQLETNSWDALVERWANSPKDFRDMSCGEASYSVYNVIQKADGSFSTNYGLGDEEARIDLNSRYPELLESLLTTAGGVSSEDAALLTERIRAARMNKTLPDGNVWADSSVSGGPFLSVHELLWIRGMSREVFDRIRDHITVNGGDRVNINTAAPAVLVALFRRKGPSQASVDVTGSLTRKILSFRERGGIFENNRNLAEAFPDQRLLSQDEINQLNEASPFVTVKSDHFRGHVIGVLKGTATVTQSLDFVLSPAQRKIEYWYED